MSLLSTKYQTNWHLRTNAAILFGVSFNVFQRSPDPKLLNGSLNVVLYEMIVLCSKIAKY